jgi:hypothetical protein
MLGFSKAGWKTLRNPSDENFLLCAAISVLSFFLFSWLVHEKAVTAVLLAMSLCLARGVGGEIMHREFLWTSALSFLSCSNLFWRDHILLSAFLMHIVCLTPLLKQRADLKGLLLVLLGLCVEFVLPKYLPPPTKYPQFWDFALNAGCALGFLRLHRVLVKMLK